MSKETLTEMIKAARERQGACDLVGYINAYCDDDKCVGREFEIRIKCYGSNPVSVRCPLCGHPAIFDMCLPGVETLEEHIKRTERDAREDVNVQRYKNRTGNRLIPVSVQYDDSLPE
jgi:hypothetical protein